MPYNKDTNIPHGMLHHAEKDLPVKSLAVKELRMFNCWSGIGSGRLEVKAEEFTVPPRASVSSTKRSI